MLFQGTVLNRAGEPIDGAAVQVWQADPNGNYDHPRSSASQPESPEFDSIVDGFQYYGTARSDSAGSFAFVTYRPGLYSYRPYSHFHFKVWAADPGGPSEGSGEVPTADLTTQFYFRDERPPFPDELVLDVVEVEDDVGSGGGYHYGSYVNGTIVLDDGGGEGMLPPSPPQAEGPFYPPDDFFAYDNDLTTRGATAEDGGGGAEASSGPASSPVRGTPAGMPGSDPPSASAASSTARATEEPTEPPATTDSPVQVSPPLSDAASQQSSFGRDSGYPNETPGPATSESWLRHARSATLLAIVLFLLVWY